MNYYEYDYVDVPLTQNQRSALEFNIGHVEEINPLVKEVINTKSKDGWEPLYPFSMPCIWFKRPVIIKKRTRRVNNKPK